MLLRACIYLSLFWISNLSAAEFDHDATRFPLNGFHRLVECEVCHVQGRFQGTPLDCQGCHGGSSQIPAGGKNLGHMPTSNQCEACHINESWQTVFRVDHAETLGTCEQCHNGLIADGKPSDHLLTNQPCESCHVSVIWNVARFDHSNITQACSSCHNGSTATGKHNRHISTQQECDQCHSTSAWLPARFDHSDITDGCSSCHNGVTATGKGNNHFVTNLECNSCHSINNWTVTNYVHTGAAYPGEHRRRLECSDCHIGNVQSNVWRFPAYQPDCAACHANDFEAEPHKKVDTPRVLYNVSELRDCSGACHIYRDTTLTTIEETRSGQHRITDPGFDD